MTSSILGFVIGLLWLQHQADLPGLELRLALLGGILLLGMLTWLGRRYLAWRGLLLCVLACLIGAQCGVLWGTWRAEMRLAETLPVALEGEDLTLTGTISSMPQRSERGWRFDFEVETPEQIPHHISLAWYDMGFRDGADLRVPPLHAGDRWQLTARLRRPHGNLNPHGFDYEAMLFERGIRATGYVRPKGEHQLISTGSRAYFIERSREAVRTKFEQTLAQLQDGAPYVGVLIALAVGDQQVVPRSQWDLFARTGITHLVSILWLLKRKYRTMTATLFRQTVPSCPRLTLTSAFQAPGSNEAIP